MDYLIAYSCIRHIINKLEYGQKFKERLVIVDGENSNRNKPYSKNNFEYLRKKLEELKQEKLFIRLYTVIMKKVLIYMKNILI